MPTYYTRQPTGLPLTPPDFASFGSQQMMNNVQLSGMGYAKVSHDSMQMIQPYTGWGNNSSQEQLYQQMRYTQQQQSQLLPNFKAGPPGLVHPSHTRYQSMDSSNTLPLPMMKQNPAEQIFDQSLHQVVEQHGSAPAKVEEKPVGGVSAVLDYEMDDMAEFVASIASGMYADMCSSYSFFSTDTSSSVLPGSSQSQPSSGFKKFVNQILTSTRLPSSTILLGLEYLSTRMNIRSMNTEKNTQLYKVLTIALLLASKFLDDNTFQNRSWAEVTGFSVTELNVLEAEWLEAINWNLHVNDNCFNHWKATWDTWLSSKQAQATILAPLNNNRRHTMSFTPTQQTYVAQHIQTGVNNGFMNDRSRLQSTQLPTPDPWWNSTLQSGEYSPPSAPETGPATPEWNLGVNWASHFMPQPVQNHMNQPSHFGRPLSQQFVPNQHTWGSQCNCAKCFSYTRRNMSCGFNANGNNFLASGYGQQVVG